MALLLSSFARAHPPQQDVLCGDAAVPVAFLKAAVFRAQPTAHLITVVGGGGRCRRLEAGDASSRRWRLSLRRAARLI